MTILQRKFTIRDGTWDGHPKSLEELPSALAGMQAAVRARCTVVEWRAVSEVPADEWLDRMRRGHAETLPPPGNEEITAVIPVEAIR